MKRTIIVFMMVFIATGAVLQAQCSSCCEKKAAKAEVEQDIIVGVLRKNWPLAMKNPSEYALEDGFLYASAQYSIGDMKVYAKNPADLTSFVGKLIVVYGKRDMDLTKIIVKKGKAPEDYGRQESMMQIRSDWVGEETGFSIGRTTHEKLKKVSFFRYQKAEQFQGLEIKRHKVEAQQEKPQRVSKHQKRIKINRENIEILFTNTFDSNISGLTLGGHYESSGRGKPSPHYNTKDFSEIKSGQKVSLLIPSLHISPRKNYRLREVIVGASGKITIAIKYRLSEK